jgi:short-chain fatty acids transporter
MPSLAGLAARLGRISEAYVPSALSIAALLTIGTAALALVVTDASPVVVLKAWGGGFWSLHTFAMRMALVLFTGFMVAVSPPVSAALARVAAVPRSPRQAVAFMAFVSMGLALLNWGLSIVGSAVLVRFLAKRRYAVDGAPADVDYRLLVASAYFGLGATWHAGLSASAPLIAATETEALTKKFGVVPIDQTLLSPFNVGLTVVTVAVLTALAAALHPKPADTFVVDPARLDDLRSFATPKRPDAHTFANRIDFTPLLPMLLGGAALAWVGLRLAEVGWRRIDIDLVNFTFLGLALVLHRTPAAVLAATEEAGSVLSGIVLQFPFYAGVYGIFDATGLTTVLGDAIVKAAPASLFPALVYLYSGLVNYFVPSGGAKWAIEAPYVLEAARGLGVPSSSVVLAYAWGDMATDLIQPFWALPLLAVAKLDFRDILGPLVIACAVYVGMVTAAFVLWG